MDTILNYISFLFEFILNLDKYLFILTNEYGIYVYLILFLILFCETGLIIAPFLPGDSLLFIAGSIAAIGAMNIYYLYIILLIATIMGDSTNYLIGRIFGRSLFKNENSRIFKRKYLHKTEEFYAKYGGYTVIIARFIPIIRTFAPNVAGISLMKYSKFLFFSVIGSILWLSFFLFSGYFLGNLTIIKNNLHYFIVIIVLISFTPIIFSYLKMKLKK